MNNNLEQEIISIPFDIDTDNIIGPVLSFLENTLTSSFFTKLLIFNPSYISVYEKEYQHFNIQEWFLSLYLKVL